MGVAVWVGKRRFEIGSPSLLKSWFSTIVVRLEGDDWGGRYPVIMRELYGGLLPHAQAESALKELEGIRRELAMASPEGVVWDFEDRRAQPPWGGEISAQIKSLAEYFVTSDGRNLLDVLAMAITEGARRGRDVTIGDPAPRSG